MGFLIIEAMFILRRATLAKKKKKTSESSWALLTHTAVVRNLFQLLHNIYIQQLEWQQILNIFFLKKKQNTCSKNKRCCSKIQQSWSNTEVLLGKTHVGEGIKVCTCAVSRSTEGKYKSSWLRSAQKLSLDLTSFCLPKGLSSSFWITDNNAFVSGIYRECLALSSVHITGDILREGM